MRIWSTTVAQGAPPQLALGAPAMVGAIVLTLRHRSWVKRQNVLEQMYRDPAKAMELKDVKSGQGL